ncbi:uncharacterized protein LOC8066208 [Sorghum bicolor]|uniref:uncharacterized protein LOC8066208 n=1 Tax=Sorghum bicolor TaxID=4558 RepID=UPI000B424E0D|nr:uncharacterized protein LOC8066208 [Sorghum bicolor]|eukprot:XP_021315251.1 uncharacterized protein LOC8066208 [Sorghum bicolor]
MSTTETDTAAAAPAPENEGVNLLKRNSDDVGWEYGVLVDPKNKDKVKCKFCNKVMQGGIYRLKQHVAHDGKNATKCPKSTDEAKENSEPHKLGPMDKWTKAIDPKATRRISFNACDNDEFKQMCEAIGQFGPGLEPPCQDSLREKLLEEEYARTKSLLQEHDAEKMKNGCSIMTDAWTDRKRRSIMNLCTNCADGTSFISSMEMSDVSRTSEVIFELVDKAIEDIGPENVVQVVTDNASNNMGAKKVLLEKRPQIFWTSCATHTINLMLQGIGNLARFKKVIEQAKAFTIFVYGHTRTLECMRYFTEGKEIVRPGVTRFASTFLTLNSILEKKDQLRKMVVHNRWDSLRDVKSKKGKDATAIVLNPTFWKDVKLTVSVFEPLFKVLRLVDGDVKPSMGFVYGEILKAKKEIKEALGNNESRFKEVIVVIDKKMKGRLDSASWWRLYGTEVPTLQKMATRILSLTSSASGCERNWSGFEAIHTKKRNRLTTTRLNKLVYIHFNSKLLNKREKIKSKKISDVLLSNDTTEAQGFLHENGDDSALVVYRDEEEEEEMEGTRIPWSVLGDAVGAEEQLQLRRSARVRELYE